MPSLALSVRGMPIDDLPGWRSMAMRFQAFVDHGAEPIQVAMLLGPSGAGKSTLFRQLTGIEVPAGGETRPTSFGCAVAAPSALANEERLSRLFPGYELQNLASPRQLSERDQPVDRLYFAASDRVTSGDALPLVLVDVPDFTTFCTENWAKAERMLERAEIVIFVVYDEAYSDNRVMENLALACRKSAFMAYVLTKTSQAAAEKKWVHLLNVTRESQLAPMFDELRADRLTAREFLARSPVYHSVRSEAPRLGDVSPVSDAAPPFESLLVGRDGERIILAGLLESTSEAVQGCRQVLNEAREVANRLERKLTGVQTNCRSSAARIAKGEFPISRLLSIAVEESQHVQPRWLQALRNPLYRFMRSGAAIYRQAKSVVQSFSTSKSTDKSIRSLGELESERIAYETTKLADIWRQEFFDEANSNGMLSAEACARACEQALAAGIPEPSAHWEQVVREATRRWCQEHRTLALALSSCGDLFLVAAGGIVVIDLVFTGGLGLGATSVFAAAPAAAGGATKLIELLQLRGVAERALAEWERQREVELTRHLQLNFADRLFRPWLDRLATLNAESLDRCQNACNTLLALIDRLRGAA